MQEIARKLNILYNSVYFYLHRKALTKAKKKKCEALMHSKAREQVQLVLRIKKLTHPQMRDSLHSTCKKKFLKINSERQL